MKLVECVPNFSEGRDERIISEIVAAVSEVPDTLVLHIDSGADANRTVVTYVGTPSAAEEAAFRLIERAAALIDMTKQRGAHPRLGATDVFPFVPLGDSTLGECADIARSVGARVGSELGIPVYLYEHAAHDASRRELSAIRRGEYEGLAEKILLPDWKPDFGPPRRHEQAGACIIGARNFLLAYNVNLDTSDIGKAKEIARAVRSSGGSAGGHDRLPSLKAIGWLMPSFGCAQVSMNLTDYETTGLYDAYMACSQAAERLGCRLTGSELIGLAPEGALVQAGRRVSSATDPLALACEAVRFLGLDQLNEFKLDERVIEYRLAAAGFGAWSA